MSLRLTKLSAAITMVALASACGSGSSTTSESSLPVQPPVSESLEPTGSSTPTAASVSPSTPLTAPALMPRVRVTNVWAQFLPNGVGAVYLEATPDQDDAVIGVRLASGLEGQAEVHEVVTVDGAMTMRETPRIDVAAGETLVFKSGSFHIMLMDVAESLAVDESFLVELLFETAGAVTFEAWTREVADGLSP